MTLPVRPTCNPTTDVGQVYSQIERVEAALTEKSRCCRVMRMKLGSELTDTALAEQMATSREVICRWRKAEDRTAPTLVSLLLASDHVFDVMVSELLQARQRLGHGKRTVVDGDAAERSERLTAALARAAAVNDDLLAIVEESRRSR
jgi:hypothetical protein